MDKVLKKGYNIPIKGKADKKVTIIKPLGYISLSPQDFLGLKAKVLVKEGDSIKGGDPLFTHKSNEEMLFTSPISGKVKEIIRGEKRAVLEIIAVLLVICPI